MSNIFSFSSLKKESKKKENAEEFYAGGATSGTAVWRPNDGPGRAPISSSSSTDSQNPMSSIIARAQQNSATSQIPSQSVGTITLYANGFQIGDGEFRPSSDARNAVFLADLKQGHVPHELEKLCKDEMKIEGNEIAVNLVDKTSETYVPPKPKFSFANSQGQSLGTSSSNPSTLSAFAEAKPAILQPVLDNDSNKITLQLVLSDRRRIKETISGNATVMQLYGHVMSLSGLAGFELIAGFPPKPLTDPNQTLSEAKLNGAQVQQRGGA